LGFTYSLCIPSLYASERFVIVQGVSQLASLLLFTLSPYSQAPAVAPYSLSPSDLRPMARLEVVAASPKTEVESGVGPLLALGVESLRGSRGPFLRLAGGLEIIRKDLRLKILPEVVFSTGSKWDASVMGGMLLGASLVLEARVGELWIEPSMKILNYRDRGLGDPEGETRYSQDDSLQVGLGATYQPEAGLYASLSEKVWFLGASRLGSPGLALDFEKTTAWVSEAAVGWTWDSKRAVAKWVQVSNVRDAEDFSFQARGAFGDRLLAKQRAELEMAWNF
jgi:hypothetical protein